MGRDMADPLFSERYAKLSLQEFKRLLESLDGIVDDELRQVPPNVRIDLFFLHGLTTCPCVFPRGIT
jgi:hypothetical protein